MSTYIQIRAQIDKLEREAEVARKREIAETILNIKKAITAFGLTADDLGLSKSTNKRRLSKKAKIKRRGRPSKKITKIETPSNRQSIVKKAGDKRSVVAPKFRDQASGATWTGRGKQPKWLSEAIAAGHTLNEFRI